MESLLAIDLGTTTIKAGAFTPSGDLLGLARREYDFDSPHESWAQVPFERVWTAVVRCVRSLADHGYSEGLRGIGFSSQGHTFLCRDADGQPLHPYVTWLDSRAAPQAEELLAGFGADEIYNRTGYVTFAGYVPAAKLLWLRREMPDVFRRIHRFVLIEDDVILRLTGEALTDYVLAATTGLFDLRSKRWWPEMLDAVGLAPEALPRAVPAGTVAGRLLPDAARELGLPDSVPVCVGTNDQLAGALGAANVEPGIVTETTGTALAVVGTLLEPLADRHMGIPWWGHPLPDRYAALAFSSTAAVVLKWFKDSLWPEADYDRITEAAAEIEPGSGGLTLLPHFSGTGCPDFLESARGCLCGLQLRHTRSHIARAVLEGVAFSLKDLVSLISKVTGGVSSIRSLGGAASSDLWLQIKADALGIPVERPRNAEAAMAGACALAASAVGYYEDSASAARNIYAPQKVFVPNAEAAGAYEEAYGRYRDAYRRQYGV